MIYDGSLERLREEYGTHRMLVVTLAEACPDFAVPGTELESPRGQHRAAALQPARDDRRGA